MKSNHCCFYFFVVLSFFGQTFAAETLTFTLLSNMKEMSLKDFDGKEVVIRGFYYQTSQGESFLASQPDLKSCCIGSQDKFSRQIVLDGQFNLPKSRAITFKGSFFSHPSYTQEGKLIGIYLLKNPQIVEEINRLSLVLVLSFGIIASLSCLYFFKVRVFHNF